MALARQIRTNQTVTSGRKARRRLEKQRRTLDGPTRKAAEFEALWRKGHQEVLAGRLEAAEKTYREAIRLDHQHAAGHHVLGQLLVLLNRAREAYGFHVRAAELEPGNAAFLAGLGHCLVQLGLFDAAVLAFTKATENAPFEAELHVHLARAQFGADDSQAAIASFRRALDLDPDNIAANFELGNQYEVQGRFDLARECYDRVLKLDPDRFEVHLRLASIGETAADEQDALLEQLEKVLAGRELPDDTRSRYLFAGARINQRLGRHDEAFDLFVRANAIQAHNHPFDREGFLAWTDGLKTAFVPEVFETLRTAGSDSEQPVFIVGMPRSGTTLVEQIVSSHPLVAGAGELAKLDQLIGTMAAIRDSDLRFPEDLARIDPHRLAGVGDDYLRALRRDGRAEADRITDKYVFNFYHLGLIAILFPRARIIHCRRDPLDTCLSCLFQNFSSRMAFPFWHRLEDIGFFYRHYEMLMAHWHKVVPIPILDVQYEDVVADQEQVSRRLIAFVGLDWDDACLRFYENKRAVATASVWQVRQKVYTSSVQRWRAYERHLEPLRRELAGRA